MDKNSILTKQLQEMQKELSIISSLTNSFSKILDKKDFGLVLNQSFKSEFNFADFLILRFDEINKEDEIFYSTFEMKSTQNQFLRIIQECVNSAEPIVFDLKDFSGNKIFFSEAKNKGIRSVTAFCLPSIGEHNNVIFLFYKNYTEFNDQLERILKGISTQLSITIRNILFSEKLGIIYPLTPSLQKDIERNNRQEEKGNKEGFNGIIGNSEAMQQIYQQISQIASSSSNIIIYGETGTGKELIAQAIHDLSFSSHRVMVRINCASIPANLIESELFGHEKGSFTGATEQRKGKFELANNSTIFLDEIGELPLQLQGRLLRVLQEKEIERIGGNKTIKVNARVIAATNRILENEVAKGNFRSDLFYRLTVFPIHLPPLRERKEDIPLLANYFLGKLNLKTGKKINGFSQKVMIAMCKNAWPGNIRELQNMIERSFLTTKDGIIKEMDFPKIFNSEAIDQNFQIKTLHQVEKEHILKIIEKCNGRIFGPNGAALLLGVPPTTLISKMQKLGIQKEHYLKKTK
jgi:formate hydrogenlyase transcriptional activator